MNMLPRSRPQVSRAEVEADIAKFAGPLAKGYPMIAVGYRAYYRDTMGKPGVNDHAIYDDAICLVTPTEFIACNGNTDPTAQEGAVEGRATLAPGFYPMWRLDLHKGQYRAFCQRLASCIVFRTGTEAWQQGANHERYGRCLGKGLWSGYFGINGHRGGVNTTTSEGCQTVPEPQWSELIQLAEAEARRLWQDKWKEKCIPYLLIDRAA